MRSVFLNILELKDLDIRDKKSAIIDFIAAGIETVGDRMSLLLPLCLSSILTVFLSLSVALSFFYAQLMQLILSQFYL